jgi:DNA-binding transcriptional LysR family regulator
VELRQPEAFVALAAELRFGRAADRASHRPPTLSELIRCLERELGMRRALGWRLPLAGRSSQQVAPDRLRR